MKAIMVMYDSLNRAMLSPYGCEWTHTPNFERLARHSTRYDRCYVGSMPCMPARRELHTGRQNFLHRSWGPLEPFDDSMPELLDRSGVCSHLSTDHYHYLEDGGATYHNRYTSWECFRGQEGDRWKEDLARSFDRRSVFPSRAREWENHDGFAKHAHDTVNRDRMKTEADTPHAKTFEAGLEFIETNHAVDNWFLHIESFDPHEPFFCDPHYQSHFEDPLPFEDTLGAEWPPYRPVTESAELIETVRNRYAALLEKCDTWLGKVLDAMDRFDLWRDTMLIVCTDHGFLLGEHGWWGKNAMPCWNEIANTPLFVWDPRFPDAADTDGSLVQMPDLAVTLLDYFAVPVPKDMTGRPLRLSTQNGETLHEAVLYGYHGEI